MFCPCKLFMAMAKWLTCGHYAYDSCLLYVGELVWLDPVKGGVQMTHLLSSSDVIYTRVIKRDDSTSLVHPGCLLLRIWLPCRIMTPARTRLGQSVLDCVPFGLMSTVVGLFGKLFPHGIKLLWVVLCHLSKFFGSSIMTSNCSTWNAFVLRVWRDAWSILSTSDAFHYLCTLDYLLHSHQCQQLQRIFSS